MRQAAKEYKKAKTLSEHALKLSEKFYDTEKSEHFLNLISMYKTHIH